MVGNGNTLVIPGTKRPLRAVLFDVDGTLYHQPLLRCLMALELCTLPWKTRFWQAARTILMALQVFRHVREELRNLGEGRELLEVVEYQEAAKRVKTKVAEATLRSLVKEWMLQRPLKYLPWCRLRGLKTFLQFLANHDIPMGVFSDYPVIEKLQALSLIGYFNVTLCATDAAVNAFKPHPKGFRYACKSLGDIPPEEVLYIGDRPEIDAVGASTAGMPCAILLRQKRGHIEQQGYFTFSSFHELQYAFIQHP